MIEIHGIFADVDLNPIHLAAKPVTPRSIVCARRRTSLKADVKGLVGGKDYGLGLLHTALADLLAVHEQCHGAALRQAASVVFELHPYLMCPRRNPRRTFDRVPVHAIEVVVVFRLAVFGVEAPAANDSAHRDDYAFRARWRYDDFGRD